MVFSLIRRPVLQFQRIRLIRLNSHTAEKHPVKALELVLKDAKDSCGTAMHSSPIPKGRGKIVIQKSHRAPSLNKARAWISKPYVQPLLPSAEYRDLSGKVRDQLKTLGDHLDNDEVDKIDFNWVVDLMKNAQNPLKTLIPEQNSKLFNAMKSRQSLNQLVILDWHRFFENVTQQLNYQDPVPDLIKKTSLEMLKTMKSCGVSPDAYIYSCIYLAVSNDASLVLKVYDFVHKAMDSPQGRAPVISNKSIQNLLLVLSQKHMKSVKLDLIIDQVWNDVKSSGIKPTIETCVAFLKCKPVERHLTLVTELHRLIKAMKIESGKPWDINVVETLVESHLRLGNLKAVDKLFEEAREDQVPISRACFSLYLESLLKQENYKHMIKIQKLMMASRKGFAFENSSIQSLISASVSLSASRNLQDLLKFCETAMESQSEHIHWRIYEYFISGFSSLNQLDDAVACYNKYKTLRQREVEIFNKSNGHKSPLELINETEGSDTKLQDAFVKYKVPHPPRRVLALMAEAYGRSKNEDRVLDFFKSEVFLPELHQLYRLRHLTGTERGIQVRLLQLQRQIDDIRKSKKGKGRGSTRTKLESLKPLKEEISKLNRKAKRVQAVVSVGKHGPFGNVYEGLDRGWRVSLRDKISQNQEIGEDLMRLESLMKHLGSLESQVSSQLSFLGG